MPFSMECFPAFNYARDEHEVLINESGAAFRSPNLNLQLSTDRHEVNHFRHTVRREEASH